MKEEEIIEIVNNIKPLPFFNKSEKDIFQLALDLVIAAIKK